MDEHDMFNDFLDGDFNEDDENDMWRFDDTRLDDLEDFLRQVSEDPTYDIADLPKSPKSPKKSKATGKPSAPGMSNNVLQLIRDVNNELANAQREVLVLRDEKCKLLDMMDRYETDMQVDEELRDLYDAAADAEATTEEKFKELEEMRREHYELKAATCGMHAPTRHTKTNGPSKRGLLTMKGNKKLDCELIGGETWELSDRSRSGHVHVSKIGLTHVEEVKVVSKYQFGVKTERGTYIMEAATESEAKSWVRAITVSKKVALDRAEKARRGALK